MKSIVLIFSVFALIAGTSCKNKEKASSTTTNSSSSSSTKNMQAGLKYRLIVSFNSIGTGIDSDAFSKMDKFVKGHAKKPVYDRFTWGREGETDIAFSLKEMKSGDQAKFISDLKAAIGASDRVNYKENEVPAGKIKKEIAD